MWVVYITLNIDNSELCNNIDILTYVGLLSNHWILLSVKLKTWFLSLKWVLGRKVCKKNGPLLKLMRRERQSLVIGSTKFQFRYKKINKTSGMRVFLNMLTILELFISFIVVENWSSGRGMKWIKSFLLLLRKMYFFNFHKCKTIFEVLGAIAYFLNYLKGSSSYSQFSY